MTVTEEIVKAVVERLLAEKANLSSRPFPAEMSARHVHLSQQDLQELFGIEKLENIRDISQPGQFLSNCRVRLLGSKGSIDNVAVLGPVRKATQVEISATDARTLGVKAPVRLSGDLADAGDVFIQVGDKIISRKAAIVAKRHIHMTPGNAREFNVQDGQCVSVRVLGNRSLILENVPVRVTEASALALHMDTDEANAAGAGKDCQCVIIGCSESPGAVDIQPVTQPAEKIKASSSCVTLEDKLITEKQIIELHQKGVTCLRHRKGQLITPLARDALKIYAIRLEDEV